jgi:hypothetical protein
MSSTKTNTSHSNISNNGLLISDHDNDDEEEEEDELVGPQVKMQMSCNSSKRSKHTQKEAK